ncbi:cytochrome c1 [Roseateles sp. BYS180W]|uniref:Cytochrome c1 n=1 Tax=Roseateles rivi TaxID=3299028 RepID=A0ABW7FW22_9BURK
MNKLIATLLTALSLGLGSAAHAAGGGIAWDKFPEQKMTDITSLQRGAQIFVNYCLNCHSASFMRYNRLQELGLSEAQIKANLMFAADKVGETMKVAMDPRQAKEWFGATPPDLTLIARSRSEATKGSGADYLYTYLRTYYRDETKATGWNNLAFPSVGMPHVLWELQGVRTAKFVDEPDPHDASKTHHVFKGFEQQSPGSMTAEQYDNAVADLVAFLKWMGEPTQGLRFNLGVAVLLFLGVFTLFAWRLNASYWKDIK